MYSKRQYILAGLLFAGVLPAILLYRWPVTRDRFRSLWWRPLGARVEEARVKPLQLPDDSQMSYVVSIKYSYEVEGRRFESDVATFDGAISFRRSASAQKFVEQHAVGSTIQAWCNPMQPAKAVLFRGPHEGEYIVLLIGGTLSAIGVGILTSRRFRYEWLERERAGRGARGIGRARSGIEA